MIKRYGKKIEDIFERKQNFILQNDALLDKFHKLFELYSKQPVRTKCKNCEDILVKLLFSRFGVDYYVCSRCGHFNGGNEDTREFCEELYSENDGKSYGATYNSETEEDYFSRVRDVYVPKASFLLDCLASEGNEPRKLRFADFGAGSGYFVAALLESGIEHVRGYEVSKSQISLSETMLKRKLIDHHSLDQITSLATSVEAEVLSLVGVLEHVQHPRDLLRACKENPNLKYLFFSIPMFSPCVMLEKAFPEVMTRHLGPSHTHLYTESSINYFCQELGFVVCGEWWFGTDLMDLFRSILVTLSKQDCTSNALECWKSMFVPLIDDLQVAQDRKHLASEVHMLVRLSA